MTSVRWERLILRQRLAPECSSSNDRVGAKWLGIEAPLRESHSKTGAYDIMLCGVWGFFFEMC